MKKELIIIFSFFTKHKRAALLSFPLFAVVTFIIFDFFNTSVYTVRPGVEQNATAALLTWQEKTLQRQAKEVGVPELNPARIAKYSNILIRNGQLARNVKTDKVLALKGLPENGAVVPGFLTKEGWIGFYDPATKQIFKIEDRKGRK